MGHRARGARGKAEGGGGRRRGTKVRRRVSARGERPGESQKGAQWLPSLFLFLFLSLSSLARSRGVERYSFRGGGRLDEAVVVAEEEEEEEEMEEDGVRPINHGIIIESVISKAC